MFSMWGFIISKTAGQAVLEGLPVIRVYFPFGNVLWSLGWTSIQESSDCAIAITCNGFIDTPPNSLHYCCSGIGKIQETLLFTRVGSRVLRRAVSGNVPSTSAM